MEQGKAKGFCVLLRIRWAGRAAAKAGTEHSPAEGRVPHLCFGGMTAAFGPQGTMQTNSGALCSQAPQSFPGSGTWSLSWVQLCLSSSRRSVLPGGRHRSNRSTGELCLSLVSRELRVTGGFANSVLQVAGGLFAWETQEDGALRALCVDILGSLDVSPRGMTKVSCLLPCSCGHFLPSGHFSSCSPTP